MCRNSIPGSLPVDSRFSVHEHFDVSGIALRGERMRQVGYKVFSHKTDELLCEVTLDPFVSGSLDRLRVGIGGMDGEATSGLEVDVKGVFEFPIFQRQLQNKSPSGKSMTVKRSRRKSSLGPPSWLDVPSTIKGILCFRRDLTLKIPGIFVRWN